MVDNLVVLRALFIRMSAAVACMLHARIRCKQQAMPPPESGLLLGKQPCASMAKLWTTASVNCLTVALSIYLMSGPSACMHASSPFCGERVSSVNMLKYLCMPSIVANLHQCKHIESVWYLQPCLHV
jgi:hypothetical protein